MGASVRTSRRSIVAAVLLAVSAAGCGGGGQAGPGPVAAGEPTVEDSAPVAQLVVLDTRVELAAASDDEPVFHDASEREDLQLGEQVRTDDAGFGEITYPDGSLTRLGPDTSYTVESLTETDEGVRVSGRLDVGRTWHRVRAVTTSDGQFEVETAVATASVRGTAFTVICEIREVCAFAVYEGLVQIQTTSGETVELETGQSVVVRSSGPDDVQSLGPTDLEDEFVSRNVGLDSDTDPDAFPEPELSPSPEPEPLTTLTGVVDLQPGGTCDGLIADDGTFYVIMLPSGSPYETSWDPDAQELSYIRSSDGETVATSGSGQPVAVRGVVNEGPGDCDGAPGILVHAFGEDAPSA